MKKCFQIALYSLLMVTLWGKLSAQVNQLNGNILTQSGEATDELVQNQFFELNFSFVYEPNQDYVFQITLPENVSWDNVEDNYNLGELESVMDVSPLPTIGNVYALSIKHFTGGRAGFPLSGFQNLIAAICEVDQTKSIGLEMFRNNVSTDNSLSSLTLDYTVDKKNDEIPGITITNRKSGQEGIIGDVPSEEFPFYVEFSMYETNNNSFITYPKVDLLFPTEKMTLLSVYQYYPSNIVSSALTQNDGFPVHFHDTQLEESVDYTPLINGEGVNLVVSSENNNLNNTVLGDNSNTYETSRRRLRFYFAVDDANILDDDIKLVLEGGTYQDCAGTETLTRYSDVLTFNNFGLANLTTVVTQDDLEPSFENSLASINYCRLGCGSDGLAYTGIFHFESNHTYTENVINKGDNLNQFRTENEPVPVIELDILANKISPSSLIVVGDDIDGLVIEYETISGERDDVDFINGSYSFLGIQNISKIYITNYAEEGSTNFHADFDLTFTTMEESNVEDLFKLSYLESENTKIYEQDLAINSNSCSGSIFIDDSYEKNDKSGFETNSIFYRNGDIRTVKIDISSLLGVRYELRNYSFKDLKYKVHPDMTAFIGTFNYMEGSTFISSQSRRIGLTQRPIDGDLYENIQVKRGSTTGEFLISFDLNLVEKFNQGFFNCNGSSGSISLDKLFLTFTARVNDNATYSPDVNDKRSTFDANNNSGIFQSTFAKWNISEAKTDAVSLELDVLCPGDQQETEVFAPGTDVLINYEISNTNQDLIRKLEVHLPLPTTYFSYGMDADFSISTTNLGELSTTGWLLEGLGEGLILTPPSGFVLNGNDKLTIGLIVTLQEGLAENEKFEELSFILSSFETVGGLGRSGTGLNEKGTIIASNTSLCLPEPPCEDCVPSFSPIAGEEYLLGAWVKEDYESTADVPLPDSYANSGILISFNNGDLKPFETFKPVGSIIDGWQRIEQSFIVPEDANTIVIELVNEGGNDVFFDDIRIHPWRSNMKSYVYDPSTQRLTAELDENNYSTMYEYDDEGNLIRVKKETERGVMTIQETRINQSKINDEVQLEFQKNK